MLVDVVEPYVLPDASAEADSVISSFRGYSFLP